MWECRYPSQLELRKGEVALTGIIILDISCKLLSCLIFRYSLRVDLALFDKPYSELLFGSEMTLEGNESADRVLLGDTVFVSKSKIA